MRPCTLKIRDSAKQSSVLCARSYAHNDMAHHNFYYVSAYYSTFVVTRWLSYLYAVFSPLAFLRTVLSELQILF